MGEPRYMARRLKPVGQIPGSGSDRFRRNASDNRIGLDIARYNRARGGGGALADGDARQHSHMGSQKSAIADHDWTAYGAKVRGGEVMLERKNRCLNRDTHVFANRERESAVKNHAAVDDASGADADSARTAEHPTAGRDARAGGDLYAKEAIQEDAQKAGWQMTDEVQSRVPQFGGEASGFPGTEAQGRLRSYVVRDLRGN